MNTVPEAMTVERPRARRTAVDAGARGGRVGTTAPGVSWAAVTAAIAMHVACLAATVSFVHAVTPPAASPAEQAVQMAFVPSPATPTKVEAVASPEPAAAAPLSEAAAVAPEAVPPEPTNVAAVDQADEWVLPEPVAAPPVAGAQTVEAPAEQAAKMPETSAAAVPPAPPPALPPAEPQPHLSALRPMTPRVASSRGGVPVHAPQQSHVAIAAAAPGAAGREAAHDADQEASLEAHIRDAVQAAVRYPIAARMMDITGRARVQLDYRNGVVDGPLLAQSSGTPMLDQAALRAAQSAHYPATPPMLAGRLMRFLVWVEFRAG